MDGEAIFGALALMWIACGIIGHVVDANERKTWCGTPVWKEPTTYLMFYPAMIAGPIMLMFLGRDRRRP